MVIEIEYVQFELVSGSGMHNPCSIRLKTYVCLFKFYESATQLQNRTLYSFCCGAMVGWEKNTIKNLSCPVIHYFDFQSSASNPLGEGRAVLRCRLRLQQPFHHSILQLPCKRPSQYSCSKRKHTRAVILDLLEQQYLVRFFERQQNRTGYS